MCNFACLEDVYIRGDEPPAGGLGEDEPLDDGEQAEGEEAEHRGQGQQEQVLRAHSGIVIG